MRRTYDRIGGLQDTQAFYEDAATNRLRRHGAFGSAEAVFEFGCGTGRFAQRLLRENLSPTARYLGVDLSHTMVQLAQTRLAAYAPRAAATLAEGGPPTEQPTESFDRFVSNYVFDLLAFDDINAVIREARRMLRPEGLLCVSGLSSGTGPVSRFVARAWTWVQATTPALVGGCRPVDMLPFLSESDWRVQYHAHVVRCGIPSEVVVAQKKFARDTDA